MPRSPLEDIGSGDATVRQVAKYFVWGAIGLIVLIAILSIPFTIQAGERGVITTFGKPSARIADEGLNLKIPFIQHVYKYNVKTIPINFDNKAGMGDKSEYSSLFSFTKDQMEIQVAIVVNYHIQPTDVMNVYQTYGTQNYYNLNVIEPIIREAVKAESAKFNVAEMAIERETFSNNIHKNLATKFEGKKAVLESVYVVNIELPPAYKESIDKKMIAEQDALAAKNKLEQVTFEAQQKVAEAQGKADAMKLEVLALSQNSQILELRTIEHWDGKLPLVVSYGNSGSNNMFDISELMRASNSNTGNITG